MAQKVLIVGESGNGKSTSLRNCIPEITYCVSPVGKRFPFKHGKLLDVLYGVTDTSVIIRNIRDAVKKGKKLIVIDDFQYIMSVPYMHRIQETGWDKYNDFGKSYFDLIDLANELPEDVVMVYMSHTETLDDGITRVKLIGKLLREKITIEGLFETVLAAKKVEDKYYFITQSNGRDTLKSPMGMFEDYSIDNDLQFVYEAIKNYFGVGDYKPDEVIQEMSEEVAGDLEKPQKRTRTTSHNNAEETSEKPKRGRGKSRMEKKIEEGVGNQNEDDPFSENFLNEVMPVTEEKPSEVKSDPLPDEFDPDEAIAKVEKLEEESLNKPKRRERKKRN